MKPLGLTCLIALDDAAEVLPGPLERALALHAPRSSLRIDQEMTPQDADQALIADIDGQSIAMVLFDQQLPPEDYAHAVEKSLFWRDAGMALADHRAFLAISGTQPFQTHGLARAQASAITRLAAAACECLPALGALWLGARTVSSPEAMVRATAGLAKGYWPVDIWIGWYSHGQIGSHSSVIGFQTLGAADFLGFELLCEAFETTDVKEPLRLLYSTAGYLMANGDVIPDGRLVEVKGERRTQYKMLFHPDGRPGVARLRVLERDHRKR
ncbi:MAG: hypothetical protein AAGK00_17690 [Pseudomonadota bacterium]